MSKNLCYAWLLVTLPRIRYVTLFAPVCFFVCFFQKIKFQNKNNTTLSNNRIRNHKTKPNTNCYYSEIGYKTPTYGLYIVHSPINDTTRALTRS